MRGGKGREGYERVRGERWKERRGGEREGLGGEERGRERGGDRERKPEEYIRALKKGARRRREEVVEDEERR